MRRYLRSGSAVHGDKLSAQDVPAGCQTADVSKFPTGITGSREFLFFPLGNLTRSILVLTLFFSVNEGNITRCDAEVTKGLVGWVERVRLYPGDVTIQAKLDTGADSSSLHATDTEEFQKDGKQWVRFSVEDRFGKKIPFERQIRSHTRIKRGENKADRRPVVKLGLCIGSSYMETEVNLVDRSGFDYPMLIGRNFLAGNVVVDPSSMHTIDPDCKDVPKSR